jgi:hypothetical protein
MDFVQDRASNEDDTGTLKLGPFKTKGIIVLKFGQMGVPREVFLHLSEDENYLTWRSKLWSVKFGARQKIALSSVVEKAAVKYGQTTSGFRRYKRQYADASRRSLSVVYRVDGEVRSLDVICPNPAIYRYLAACLESLIKSINEKRWLCSIDSLFFAHQFGLLGARRSDGMITKSQLSHGAKKVDRRITDADVDKFVLNLHRLGTHNVIDFYTYEFMINLLSPRRDLMAVWECFRSQDKSSIYKLDLSPENNFFDKFDPKQCITDVEFMAAWNEMQVERLDIKKIRTLILSAKRHIGSLGHHYGIKPRDQHHTKNPFSVDFPTFRAILTSKNNDAYDPFTLRHMTNMVLPITDYYINACTRVLGLPGSKLSSEDIVKDLSSGTRCLEIIVSDGPRGVPIVRGEHNGTNAGLSFSKVMQTIARSAFSVTPYPLLLIVTSSCSIEYQHVMARNSIEELGNLIYKPANEKKSAEMPTPEQLKYKVVLIGFRNSNQRKAQYNKAIGAEIQPLELDGDDDEDDDNSLEDIDLKSTKESRNKNIPGASTDKIISKIQKMKDQSRPIPISHPMLSDLMAVDHLSSKWQGGNENTSLSKDKSMSPDDAPFFPETTARKTLRSFSEKTVSKIKSEHVDLESFVDFCTLNICRVIPSRKRKAIANMDPALGWAFGAQLSVISRQIGDFFVVVNGGFFRGNGGAGFVPKPWFLLSETGARRMSRNHTQPSHQNWLQAFWGPACKNAFPVRINIRLISGFGLPYPSKTDGEPNQYVQVIFSGAEEDRVIMSTGSIPGNTYNPVWNEMFSVNICRPDVCIVTFRVMQSGITYDDFVCACSIPLCHLRRGVRVLPLFDSFGEKTDPSILHSYLISHITILPMGSDMS